VYLQREEVYRAFQDFLRSDKTCLILTGRSGVGKSNFILSLLDEYQTSDTAYGLAYNGARLSSEAPLEQVLTADFSKFVKLVGREGEGDVKDALREVDRIDGVADKRLILFIDTINENPQAKELLRRIDALVEGNTYPWLKVVISCRPETWHRIKRGVRLAEHKYYRWGVREELGVELEPFSYAGDRPAEYEVRVEPFTRAELPQAYERYRSAYQLATSYEEVPPQIRQLLRDPLVLWLVAETYKQHEIPSNLRVRDLVQSYLEMLIRTERLDRQDLLFLEVEIVPRLFQEGHYANALTSDQIKAATIVGGQNLAELIFNDDVLPGGRRVNQSYRNLVDAEILIELGAELDYAVGFKYERFYEFFAGRYLQGIAEATRNRVYEEVILALPSNLFLWGALVQALTLELAQDNVPAFVALVPKGGQDRLLRNVLVTALTNLGEANLSKAEAVIGELIGPPAPPPRTFFGELWRLLRPAREGVVEVPIQQVVAVEAAARLRMTSLLVEVAANPSPGLRAVAVLHSFYLWKRDPSTGFQVLEGLSCRVTGRFGLPNPGVAEAVLALSGAILGMDRGSQTLVRLLAIGRSALRRVLLLGDVDQRQQPASLPVRFRRIAVRFLHRQMLSTLLSFVIRMLTGWSHAGASFDTLGHVFSLSREQKDLLQTLVPFLDPDVPGLVERLEDIICVAEWGDQVGQTIAELAVLSHGVVDLEKTMPILNKMTSAALSHKPPRFWVWMPTWTAWQIALRQSTPSPKLRELSESCIRAVQEDPESWAVLAKRERPVPIPTDSQAGGLGGLVGLAYTFQGDVESAFLTDCLEKAMVTRNDEYLRLYITHEVMVIFEHGLHQAALQALQPIAAYDGLEVREAIVELLARAHQYEPEPVEDLLLQGGFPQEVVARVLAYPPVERLNDLMTWQVIQIIYDLFLLADFTVAEVA
jgi:hypothetical protein